MTLPKRKPSGAQYRKQKRLEAAAQLLMPGEVVHRPKIASRLVSVRDWRTELGSIYRDMRMNRIPADVGTKLAFVANFGAQLAKVEQELVELGQLRSRLDAINGGTPTLAYNPVETAGEAIEAEALPTPAPDGEGSP